MAIFINPDHYGDNLPGTGSLGGSPIAHSYKRAVENPPPRVFSVQALPATKIGSSYCYGIRIFPETEIEDNATISSGSTESRRSSRSSTSAQPFTSEYVVWRRWEDCLNFQEILENEYTLMARAKRQRLAAGKGVKKGGVYIHSDQAASFESLPPGPEAKSIAIDIHDIIPKLSRRGTLFRPSQSTIDQRSKEFQAMLGALFSEDVPTLISELRDNRVVRDFFGFWRLDRDHNRKAMEKMEKMSGKGKDRESRASIASSTFSAYFSPTISVSTPNAYGDGDVPPSPSATTTTTRTHRRRRRTEGAVASGSGSSPYASSSQVPSTAPIGGAQFTLSETGSIAPTSMIFDEDMHLTTHDNGLRSAPVPTGSSRPWSVVSELGSVPIMFIPPSTEEEVETTEGDSTASGSPSDEAMTPTALEPLPEDEELVPEMSRMTINPNVEDFSPPPPARRPRGNSVPDRSRNRNCVILGSSPSGPTVVERINSVHSDASSEDSQSEVSHKQSTTPNTASSSSRHSSVAFSTFEDTSSWRTSVASDSSMTSCTSMNPTIDTSYTETDATTISETDGSPVCPATPLEPNFPDNLLAPRASIATMNSLISNSSFDGIIPKGFGFTLGNGSEYPGSTRSFSNRMQSGIPPSLVIPEEGMWFDNSEELLDASFYDPSLVTPTSPSEDSQPESPTEQHHNPQPQRESISPRDYYARQNNNRSPNPQQFAWNPRGSALSFMSTTTTSTVSRRSMFGQETFTIKAMKEDVNVLLRVTYAMEFAEVRDKIREKFQVQEGMPLSDSFAVAFVPPLTPPLSSSGNDSPRPSETPRLQFIQNDYEWVELIEGWTKGKLTLRIFDRN